MPRIKDYTEATAINNDDYLVLDGSTDGARAKRAGIFKSQYAAELSLDGATAAITAELGNNTGVTPTLAHTATGTYTLTWASGTPWTASQAAVFVQLKTQPNLTPTHIAAVVTSTSVLTIYVYDSAGSLADTDIDAYFKAESYY